MNQRTPDEKGEEKNNAGGANKKEPSRRLGRNLLTSIMTSQRKPLMTASVECKKFFHNLLIEQGRFILWLNTYKDLLFERPMVRLPISGASRP